MTELDSALVTLREDAYDSKKQSAYYDLVLNATFFLPAAEEEFPGEVDDADRVASPMVIEADGCDYLMLFDSRERLYGWAGAEVPCVEVPGHLLAAATTGALHWALNVGSEYSKRFLPTEISWLKAVVAQCEVEASLGPLFP